MLKLKIYISLIYSTGYFDGSYFASKVVPLLRSRFSIHFQTRLSMYVTQRIQMLLPTKFPKYMLHVLTRLRACTLVWIQF